MKAVNRQFSEAGYHILLRFSILVVLPEHTTFSPFFFDISEQSNDLLLLDYPRVLVNSRDLDETLCILSQVTFVARDRFLVERNA